MIYIIDRFEEDIAVCEDESKKRTEFPRGILYNGAKAGDWFEFVDDTAVFLFDKTEEARKRNIELQRLLFGEA